MPSSERRNLLVLLLIGLANYWEWAVLMASIYPFIDSISEEASLYFALEQMLFFSFQGIALPVCNVVVRKVSQFKPVILVTLLLSIGGNVTYIFAPTASSGVLILVGRAVAGVGAGCGGVSYSFLATNTGREKRVGYMLCYKVTCILGVIIATIASASFIPIFGESQAAQVLGLDKFTSPAAFTIVLLVVTLLCATFFLQEEESLPGEEPTVGRGFLQTFKRRGARLSALLYFLNGFMSSWIAYVMPLVAFPYFKWDISMFGWMLLAMVGAGALASFGASLVSSARSMLNDGEMKMILVCYTFMTVGITLCFLGGPSVLKDLAMGHKQVLLMAGGVLTFMTYSMCGVVLPLIASKLTSHTVMSFTMPYYLAFMSVGKATAPLICRAELLQGWTLVFLSVLVAVGLFMAIFPFLYRVPEAEDQPLLDASLSSESQPCARLRYVEECAHVTVRESADSRSLTDCNRM